MSQQPSFASAEEFERWYAANSQMSVETLRRFGRYGAPCHCGDDICTGWRITTDEWERDMLSGEMDGPDLG